MTTSTVVLLLIALMLEASSVGTAAVDPCTQDCTKYQKADPLRFALCEEACSFEIDVKRGYNMTMKCNEFCKTKKDAAEVKACMEPCKIFEDATKVALVVGACYTECVTNVKDPVEFGKCKEACARADKEGPKLVKDNALGRINECNKRCSVEGGADIARVEKCKKSCAPGPAKP